MGNLDVVIMAAGQGVRMQSAKPKVLHQLGGLAMLQRVIDTAQGLHPQSITVVTGFGAELVEHEIGQQAGVQFVLQAERLGTGHAVMQALPHLSETGTTLILSGDVPLVQPGDLSRLVASSATKALAILTVNLPDPTGYGRMVRGADGAIIGIVEQKDATPEQHKISEINTGIMAVPTAYLKTWLPRLTTHNAQKEYYLTDIVALAVADGVPVVSECAENEMYVCGVNSPMQLAALERQYQRHMADQLMVQGVRLADPERLDIRGTLVCGQDVDIDINCVFSGVVHLGNRVSIGPNCVIANVEVADDVVIEAFTHIDGQKTMIQIGEGAHIGPYARLRPGVQLAQDVHVGNFVEIKNSSFARGSKANHLAYVGDATVGAKVNIGAGTITANYDGVNKHRTIIGDESRIGSNAVLVAPVKIGKRGTIGAGSVIARNTPENALTLTRAEQKSIVGWKRPEKT